MNSPKPKILMVDDISANRLVVKAALSGLDAEIIEASCGKEALEKS